MGKVVELDVTKSLSDRALLQRFQTQSIQRIFRINELAEIHPQLREILSRNTKLVESGIPMSDVDHRKCDAMEARMEVLHIEISAIDAMIERLLDEHNRRHGTTLLNKSIFGDSL